MTVATSTSRIQYNCGGSVVAFAFTFGVGATDEIQVILTDSDGVETTLTETTHYAISATNDDYESGGTVTTVATYASGNTITILRDVPLTQESDFTENQATLYETFEDSLDKLTRINQQQTEEINRSLRIKKSSELSGSDLELPTPQAGLLLGWNAAEDGLENKASTDDLTGITAYIETLLDDVDAPTARVTLGFDQGVNEADSPTFNAITALTTPLSVANGGSGLASFSAGDLIYATGTTTLAKLAKSTDGKINRQVSDIPSWSDAVITGAAIATTSGVAVDITSIPAWAKRVTLCLQGVSTNGTSPFIAQIGDSGGIEATGYVSSCFNSAGSSEYTIGFGLMTAATAALVFSGVVIMTLVDVATNLWIVNGSVNSTGSGNVWALGGKKALSAALDRVRLTTSGGSDTFDAGQMNILYE